MNLVGFQQGRNAAGQLFDDAVFKFLNFAEINFGFSYFNAKSGCMAHGLKLMSGRDERFGWNTANVQTHAANIFLVNNQNVLAKLCGADGGNITAGTCTNDQRIDIE
ncbi:hypothetical protein D3C85_1660020 [compost metagenome]